MRISYSRISTYQRCPHKYELAYVQRIPVERPGEMLLGVAVHGALKFMHDPKALQPPSREEVIEEFCRQWKAQEANVPDVQRKALFEYGVDMLCRHYERETSRETPRVTADVERFFSLPLEGGNSITGRIDRIDVLDDGSIQVLDYKTGRRMPAQSDIEGDLQLAIYGMAAQNTLYPNKTATTSLYYLHHGLTFTGTASADQMEEKTAEIMEVIDAIERGEFPPRVEPSCDRCEYRVHCKVFRPVSVSADEKADIEAMIKELAEVEASLGALRAERKHQDERKAALQRRILDWMERADTGSYEVDDLQARVDVSRRMIFPAEAVKDILEPLGLWERVSKVTVTKTAIDDLCRAGDISPAVRRQLFSVAETQEKAIIKLRRIGGEEPEEAGE
ncbi:MAG: hypothetical protein GTN69_04540 [Armatimonadetes bacterium]|nr:hypothetical protein [Armatimonadota bacterium]NIO75153.1 hypothetical protein [Armatimonadota bacterium]NIO95777.1 hypothetical protein [Armatimonadota bacterium]